MTTDQITPNIALFEKQSKAFSLIPLNGKSPFEGGWQKYCEQKRDFKKEDFEGHNAGVCCGPASNCLVLDIDDPDAFDVLCKENGLDVPETYTVLTGTGKPHYYFKYPEGAEVGNKSLKHPVYPKHTIFDIRGNGGQVVAAGSIHPETGKLYKIDKKTKGAPGPKWLLEFLKGEEINTDILWSIPMPDDQEAGFVESLKVTDRIRRLIADGAPNGERSDKGAAVITAMLAGGHDDRMVFYVFDHYPIGEKYREKGRSKNKWLQDEIGRARQHVANSGGIQNCSQGGTSQILTPMHEQVIQKLNEKHAGVMLGGKFVVMNEIIDPVFGRPDINFSSVGDFTNRYANQKVPNPNPVGSLEISIARLWLNSPDRRGYKGLVFSPQGDKEGYYNLFRGFDVEPKEGDWSLFKRHIWEVIVSNNKDAYEYIMYWMAHLVQQPGGQRPGTAIVLRGKQGTGKGCFVSQLGRIMGSHFLHIASQKKITGSFNNHLKDALLVFVDEGIWAGDKTAEGVLKGLITEDTIMVEPKGKDAFPVRNHMRLIVASNNDWVIPAGKEERRFFVLDVSDSHMQDSGYFEPIFQQMDNGGREAMLYDLLEMDIAGYDLKKFPRTAALMDQIIKSMSPIEKFWYTRLMEGSLSSDYSEWQESIECKPLYDEYKDFGSAIGERYKLTSSEFGKGLKKLCPSKDKKRRSADHGGGRPYYHVFPPLDECRKHFEDLVRIPIDWEDDSN